MIKYVIILCFFSLSFAFSIDKDEILENFRKEVLGDNTEEIKTFQVKGVLSGSQGNPSIFKFYVKKPDMMRMDRVVKANLEQKVIRGNKSWYALMGMPHSMELADSLELVRLTGFIDPLMNPIFRDSLDAEYKGETEIEGKKAYILEFKNKLEETNKYYFDKETFRLIKREEKTYSMGFPTASEIYYRDFERVDGYLLATKVEIIVLDKSSFFNFSDLKTNVILQKSVFRMPQ